MKLISGGSVAQNGSDPHTSWLMSLTGDVAGLVLKKKWESSLLGPMVDWPPALLSTLSVCFGSPFPIAIYWGPEFVLLYNDGYRPIAADKHPLCFGLSGKEVWAEIWESIQEDFAAVWDRGESVRRPDALLLMRRRGFVEECYFDYTLSPIRDDQGQVAGIFNAVLETTASVLRTRRSKLVSDLSQTGQSAETVDDLLKTFETVLAEHRLDAPFALVCTNVPAGRSNGWMVNATSGVATGESLQSLWTLIEQADLQGTDRSLASLHLPEGLSFVAPDAPWPERVSIAIVAKLETSSAAPRDTYLVIGISPRLDLTDDYRQLTESIATALSRCWQQIAHQELKARSIVALRDREERLRFALQAGRLGSWQISTSTFEVDASDLCKTHFGLTAQGPVSFHDMVRSVDDADRRRIEDAFSYSIASGTILDVEYRAVAPGSTPRWIYLRGEPIRDPSDAVVKLTGVSLDITDRKYAEHRLELLNDSLAQRVRERTAELEQTNGNLADEVSQRKRIEAAFIQAQKMEALGKLTGGVAHDFNNVLQIINGNLQLLGLSAPLSERQQRHLQASIDGVTRGAKLASQLLSFARKQPLDPVVLNVGQMLRAMDNMFRRALGEEIATETIVGGGLWNVHVDSNHLENVLLNLAINARDAMGQGGKLTLEAANVFLNDDYARQHDEVKAGQYVVITMTDTGCGMTEEVIKQAFEPFYTTKCDGHGTGLGLSMVHGFVKQSGGHVKIYSEVGEGTAIKVYLPRSFEAVSAPVVLFDLDVPSGTETILVAEDDPIVRTTVVETLNSLGYKTLAAEDGASALTILKSGAAIDLLFSDVVMPGDVRSPELAREAKRMLPNIAILFTSGYTENAIVHGGRLDPGVALISKPYQREELARKIRHVLANEAQRSMLQAGKIRQPLKRASSKPGTILLVDDDVNVREATAAMLTMFEFEVETATSGEAAIQLVGAGKYVAVICDVELGGISGIELAHHCRRADPNVRIVIASGHGSLGIEREAPPGAFILTKPYSVEQLRSALMGV